MDTLLPLPAEDTVIPRAQNTGTRSMAAPSPTSGPRLNPRVAVQTILGFWAFY
jgi:hypothetical protein